MKKQFKVILAAILVFSLTFVTVNAVKPEEPNLTVAIQNIQNYLEDEIMPEISGTSSTVLTELGVHDSSVHVKLDQIIADLSAHHTTINVVVNENNVILGDIQDQLGSDELKSMHEKLDEIQTSLDDTTVIAELDDIDLALERIETSIGEGLSTTINDDHTEIMAKLEIIDTDGTDYVTGIRDAVEDLRVSLGLHDDALTAHDSTVNTKLDDLEASHALLSGKMDDLTDDVAAISTGAGPTVVSYYGEGTADGSNVILVDEEVDGPDPGLIHLTVDPVWLTGEYGLVVYAKYDSMDDIEMYRIYNDNPPNTGMAYDPFVVEFTADGFVIQGLHLWYDDFTQDIKYAVTITTP